MINKKNRFRIGAVIMVWMLLLSALLPPQPVSGAESYQTTAEGQGYHITFSVPDRWEGDAYTIKEDTI